MLSKVGPPPKVDLCMMRVKKKKNKPGLVFVDLRCKNQKGVKFTLPVSKADKYVCIAPNQFVAAFTYVGKIIEALKLDVLK